MCQNPCATCLANKFYLCLTCKTNQFTLKNNLCLKDPIFLIQIVCTFLLIIFIIPNLMRKRCLTLMRIFDAIQIVSYYKFINGYIQNRHVFLYMGMRAWGDWSQGWNLISNNNDVSCPIWTTQQSSLNKIIRIFVIWGGIITIMIIMGFLKTMMGDSQVNFSTFIDKNISIAISLGFYVNVQDMAFIMANAYNYSFKLGLFSNSLVTIQFIAGICFFIISLALMMWMFYRINFDYVKHLQNTAKKIYPNVYMFMFALDYDLFPSYQLTSLPERQKKIHRYSNIRVIDIFKKVAYSFLIVNSLYQTSQTLSGQIFGILGFLIFFNIVWYVSLPYDLKTQKIQFALSVVADFLSVLILLLPLFLNLQMISLILCLALFALAIVSVVLEFYLDVYNIIPVDLYETGLSVIIEDKRLLKQIQQRKRMQQQHEKMMRQIQQQNKKLKQQLQSSKKLQQSKRKTKTKIKDQSEQSLPNVNNQDRMKFNQQILDDKNINEQYAYGLNQQIQQKTSMNSDDLAQLYKIDEQKRRKIYQFNKKSQFTYSNKVQY